MTKIVFSFDDGRADNFRVFFDILKSNSFPATINITTDFVLNKSDASKMPCINKALSYEMLQDLDNEPLFEIAGHGKKHSNEIDNLLNGVQELRSFCKSKISGIASPHSQLKPNIINNNKQFFLDNEISYIRLGDRTSFIKQVFRKFNRMFFHIPFIFSWVHKQSFVKKSDKFILYSIPILHSDTVEEIFALINLAVKRGDSMILMFHSILDKGEPEYESSWSWDLKKFELLVSFIKRMESECLLKVVSTRELCEDD